jgi:hypothetical protein
MMQRNDGKGMMARNEQMENGKRIAAGNTGLV